MIFVLQFNLVETDCRHLMVETNSYKNIKYEFMCLSPKRPLPLCAILYSMDAKCVQPQQFIDFTLVDQNLIYFTI